MAWDEIRFKVSADLDFKDAVSQIQNVKSGIEGLKTSIEDMPNASRILNSSLETTATIADSISSKLSRLEKGDFKTEGDRKRLETSISNDISELNALRTLQTGKGDFSTEVASSWFGSLPNAVRKELDAVIPKVSNIIRTRTSALNKAGGVKGVTPHALSQQLMQDAEIKAIESSLRESQSKWYLDAMIERLAPNAVTKNKLRSYQIGRYGSMIQSERLALSKGDVLDLFPESFRPAYKAGKYSKRSFGETEAAQVLDAASIKELNSMLATRPIMAKAAIAAGISKRDDRGVLTTKREITRSEWENYREALYGELMDRVAGYGKGKISPYSTKKEDIAKIESRLTSSTSGDVMTSMHDLEKFEQKNAWVAGAGSKRWTKLPNEGRRAMDQYVVTKYSPFLRTSDGKEVMPKEVMISESQNTRLLGQKQWKNNDDVSDTIAIVSLAGYNKDSAEHQASLRDLFKNGRDFNGRHYIAHSTHGKGEDQIVRMVEESAYRRVMEEEDAFARQHGIPGTFWKNFDDAEIERKIANGTIKASDWGKHLEARNKGWTPTTDVGLNMDGKKIAVVDFAGMGDGATWVSDRMMPDSGQIRMGVAGKGSAFVFNGKNVGDWAKKAGVADAEGRVMMRGPDGQMYDVSGYDMIMPLDTIKNKGAYMNADGTFKSGEEASKVATALGRRYGIGMLANYSKEDHTSDNLGTQMSSFIQMSPALRDHQVAMAMRRMEELDTEAGQLKYVFGDQNDWLSRKVNQDTQLLATEAAQRRVEAHRQSLMQDLIAGRYIDFGGEGGGGIANMRLAASPLASYLLSHGGVTPEVITKARGYIEEDAAKRGVAAPKYTDEEITNMLIPDANTVLDFAHKDQDWLGVIRSPTGYGNMLHVRNLARQAEPIYRGMGIATNAGIYISEQQRDALQGADFDADEAKVVYNEQLRKDIEESAKSQVFEKATLPAKDVEYTAEQLADESQQAVLRAGRAAEQGLGMGSGSAGIRIMQLDLTKPQNRQYIKQAQRLAAYYDNRTVDDKSPTILDFSDVNAWETMGLGKEYTKFSDHAKDLFSFEDDLLNAEGKPNESDKGNVFKASNGLLVNMRRLGNMGVDDINLPAFFMANHMMAVAEQGNLYRHGMVDTSQMDAIREAMDQMGYGDAGPARKRLMETMRHLLPQFGTGERTKLTDAESRAIDAMADAAENELRAEADKYYNPETGRYGAYKDRESFVRAEGKNYGIRTARNAVQQFGITDARLRTMFGDEFIDQRYANATASAIPLLPEDRAEGELRERAESLARQIEQAEKEVAEEKARTEKNQDAQAHGAKKEPVTESKASSEEHFLIRNLKSRVGANQDLLTQALSPEFRTQVQKQLDEDLALLAEAEASGSPWDWAEKRVQQTMEKRAAESDKNQPMQGSNPESGIVVRSEEKDQAAKSAQTAQPTAQASAQTEAQRAAQSKTEAQQRLDQLRQEQESLNKEIAANQKAIDLRNEYNSLMSDAREYNNELWGFQKGKENKINDSKTFAEKYYGRSFYQGQEQIAPLDEFSKRLDESGLPPESINEMKTGLAAVQASINENIQRDFTNKSVLYAKTLAEDIEAAVVKQDNAPTRQKQMLDKYADSTKNAQSFVDFMQKRLEQGKVDPLYQKMYEDAIKDTRGFIGSATANQNRLRSAFTLENEAASRQAIENLEIQYGLRNKNSYTVRSANRMRGIEKQRAFITKQHNEGLFSDEQFAAATANLDKLEAKSSKVSLAFQDIGKTAVSSIVSPFKMITSQIERQLMHGAIREVKRFVTEFNKSMTEIQMITLKSDNQIAQLGSTLIDKAQELKISVSEITSSATTLYRQGLSDEEVSDRLDVISKFSKVSGTKTDSATKLITVAMNTGLVDNAQEAADIVTILGDSAATNAAEIEKGIEKAGAAAKADGTTFGQLAAMLTAITSTTQVGGNVAGRTLSTIMQRMNKVGTTELVYDENGNAVSGSAIAKLIESNGVDVYRNGKKRSSFDILYDLSQNWEGMSDAARQQLSTNIAGRQYSNFSAIMQGMAEGDIDKYMELLENSGGIVDKKFAVYEKSLEAGITNIKNSFDELINDLADSGALKGFFDNITGMIQGVDNLSNSFGGLHAAIIPIVALLAALGVAKTGLFSGNLAMAAVGGLAAVGIGAGLSFAGGQKTAQQRFNEDYKAYQENYGTKFSSADRLKALKEKENRTSEETEEYVSLINNLAISFGMISSPADAAKFSVEGLTTAINKLSTGADGAAEEVLKEIDEQKKSSFSQRISTGISGAISTVEEAIEESDSVRRKTDALFTNPYASRIVNYSNGEYILRDDALEQLRDITTLGGTNLLTGAYKLLGANDYVENQEATEGFASMFANAYWQDEKRNKPEYWLNRFSGLVAGDEPIDAMPITQGELETMFDYVSGGTMGTTPSTKAKTDAKAALKNVLSGLIGEYYSDEEIDYLADYAANKVVSGESVGTVLGDILNPAGNFDEQNKSIQKALQGYSAEEKVTSQQTVLPKADYFYDKVHGEYISVEEAKRRTSDSASYRGNFYYSEAEANAERQANYQAAIDKERATLYQEDLVEFNGQTYGETEADRAALQDALRAEAVAYGENKYRAEQDIAYRDIYGNTMSQGAAYQTAREKAGVYSVGLGDSANGYEVEYFGTRDEAYDKLENEYLKEGIRQMMLEDYETYRNLFSGGKTIDENREAIAKWMESRDRYLSDYYDEHYFGYVDPSDVDFSDFNQRELESYQRAKIEAENNYIGSNYSVGVMVGRKYYDNIQDAINANIEQLEQETLEAHGLTDLSDLKLIKGDGGKWKWKDQWYDTLQEAEEAITEEVTTLFGAAEEAVQIDPEGTHVEAEDLVAITNHVKTNAADTMGTYREKNSVSLAADQVLRTILSNPEEIYDTASLVRYFNEHDTGAFAALNADAAFAELIDPLVFGDTGELLSDTDIFSTFISRLREKGTYGKQALTARERGSLAQSAFQKLTEEDYFDSYESAGQHMQGVYDRFVAQYGEEAAKAKYGSPEEYLRKQGTQWLQTEERNAIQNVIGERLAQDLFTNGYDSLAEEEQRLVSQLLENSVYGVSGLTSRQKLTGVREIVARARSAEGITGYSDAVASQYMSGWSGWDQYRQLKEREEAGTITPEELSLLKQYNVALDNFVKNSEIEFEVEGLQELEKAGEILEGISTTVQNLKKGGITAFNAQTDFAASARDRNRQRWLLENGTEEEKLQVLSSTTKWDTGRIQANRADAEAYANRYFELYDQATVNSLKEAYGAEKTAEGRSAILRMAELAGYGYTDSTEGEIDFFAVDDGAQQRAGAFYGKAKSYTDKELADIRQKMISGEISKSAGDYGEYIAGASSGGRYFNEYMRLLENEELEAAEAIKPLVDAEEALAKRAAERTEVADTLSLVNKFDESTAQTIAQNKDIFTNGSNAERFSLMSQLASDSRNLLNAQYLYSNYDESKAADLASFLGVDEKEVKQAMKEGRGNEIKKAIQDKAKVLYAGIAEAFGADLSDFNLDTSDLSGVKALLLSAAENAKGEYKAFLTSLANGISESGDIIGEAQKTAQQGYEEAIGSLRSKGNEQATASWLATQDFTKHRGQMVVDYETVTGPDGEPYQQAYERPMTFAEAMETEAQSQKKDYDLYSLFNGNETIAALGGLWGRGMLSNATASSYFSDLSYGVSPGADFASNLGRDLFGGDLFSGGMFNIEKIDEIKARYQDLASGAFGPEAQSLLQTFIGIWGNLNDALSQTNAEEAAARLKDLGEQFSSNKAKEVDKYSNSLAKAQKQAEKFEQAVGLQDQKYAASRIRGKKGSQLKGRDLDEFMKAAGLSDKKAAKKYSKEMVDEVADGMKSEADKAFTNNMIKPALKTLLDGVQEAIEDENNPFTLDQFIEISTEFQETGDVDAFLNSLREHIQSKYLEPLETWTGLLAKLTLDGTIEDNGEDLTAFFEGFLEMANAELQTPNSYQGSGGGGGGGGSEKSPAQKLLEKQKHETTEAQHKVKMQEIYQTHFDFVNDYDSYIGSLGAEEQAYADLSAMYQRHIGELESMMGGLEAYSDDWWSVKEALDAARESLADVQNKIDAIETKRVEIIVQKQENEDKPSTQKQGLWEEKARGYQIRGQFESYAVSEGKRIEEIGEQRKLNETQIAELEKTLAETTEGSDAWIAARDQIWALQLENAQLANDQEEARRALQMATVEQAQTDLTNRMTPRDHVTNMLSTYGQLYQNNRQYEDYRNSLSQQNTISEESIGLYQQYRDKLTEQMGSYEEGSEAWYAARDAIYQYDEAIAQATLSIDENNRAIEQSKIDELRKQYEDLNKDLSHTDNILKAQQDRYDKNNNFTMYQAVIAERIGVTSRRIEELERQLQGYLDKQDEITEGTDAWDDLKDAAQETAEQIETTRNELEELQRQQGQSKFEHDKEAFEQQDNLDQHNLRMIQYEESMYQNRGELRNQNIMLGHENRLRQEIVVHTQDYIETLKEDLALVEEGTDEYYKIADAIYKAEENVKQNTNAIEKNTETMKKNEEQILKTYQSLINTIDAEIKARVKEQREQLSAEVSIQNQILNIIRKRYKEEFALVKKDIAEKKKALQQEKALINERLQARLKAEDTESRYAELSELQRQLALISADPTRTKDAKNLQKQIQDMEKELARTRAQDEVAAEQERIDEQMKAYDQYVAYQEEKLNEMLKDANSTQLYEELNAVMGSADMSREDRIANYMDWIRQNDDNYKYGTEAMRMQLEQNNTDSWNKMLGWIDTYWDQVHDIIDGGLDSILDYMRESRSYEFAETEASRKLMEWGWTELFENYEAAQKDDAEWNHDHDNVVTDVEDEVFEINRGIQDMYGLQRDLYSFLTGIEYDYIRPTDVDPDADKIDYKDYAGVGRREIRVGGETYTVNGPGTVSSGEGNKNRFDYHIADGNQIFIREGPTGAYSTYDAAVAAAMAEIERRARDQEAARQRIESTTQSTYRRQRDTVVSLTQQHGEDWVERNLIVGPNDEGGLVNYTGLAWVDGSMQRPESFLDAEDTANLRELTDLLSYVSVPSMIAPSEKFFGSSSTVGDINITINEAQINSEADLDRLATEIGRKFTKQISKEGLNLAGYSW